MIRDTLHRQWTIKALTPIWTGDANGQGDRLITTGLLGSIRWWCEVLVRGLGGSACDPTAKEVRCPDRNVKDPTKPGHHCVVCELFGCTGWARKFRFEVLDENDRPKQVQITKGETFKLRFTELRLICREEWALLDLTLRLIAEFGAIGGKTVLKPSDETDRANKPHHRDYGLIQIAEGVSLAQVSEAALRDYVTNKHQWRRPQHDDFAWASLKKFWCVKDNDKYLTRTDASTSTFNEVLGRDRRKTCLDCGKVHNPSQKCLKTRRHPKRYSDEDPSTKIDRWLAGSRGESKKVFSFKEPQDARRTFGFVKPGTVDFDEMRRRLKKAWPGFQDTEFLEGRRILEILFGAVTGGKP